MKIPSRFLFTHTLLVSWLILCVMFFAIISRITYLQGVAFPVNWQYLSESLARIQPLQYVLDLLNALAGITLFSLAAFSLGLGVLRWREMSLARGVTAFVLGEVIFSLVFLTFICLSHLTPVFTGGTLMVGFLSGFPILKSWLKDLERPHLPVDFTGWVKTTLWLVFIVLGLTAFLPSTRLGYDATVEYFTHAKIMAITGEPVFLYPKDPFVVSSFHPGILFTAIIQLFGDQSARMLSWVSGLAILLLGLAIGKKLSLSPRACLLFLTLMLSSTFFIDLLGDGKVELIATVPILATIYWMLESREHPSKQVFLLIGTLAGFAIISRPYNIFLIPLFIGLFYLIPVFTYYFVKWVNSAFHKLPSSSLIPDPLYGNLPSNFFWLFPPLLTLGIFHLWQNALWLGNPLAPLAYAIDVKSSTWQWQFNPSILNSLRLFYPLSVTFLNSPQSLGNISPLLVGFMPFVLVANIRRNINLTPLTRQILISTVITLALWVIFFFTVVEIRYAMFLWILLFILVAKIIESSLQNAYQSVVPFLCAVPMLLLAFISLRTAAIALTTYSPIDQNGLAHCYDFPLCTFFEPVNQLAAPGDRVLTLHAFDYYLRPDLFACSSRAEEYTPIMSLASQNPPAFWEAVYKRGFRYITFEYNFAVFHSHLGELPDTSSAPDWLNVETVASDDHNFIYHITAINPPYLPETVCVNIGKGKWELR